jgi:hypothetical protein
MRTFEKISKEMVDPPSWKGFIKKRKRVDVDARR